MLRPKVGLAAGSASATLGQLTGANSAVAAGCVAASVILLIVRVHLRRLIGELLEGVDVVFVISFIIDA